MYRVHVSCPECGRRFSYDSDKPIECPFTSSHGEPEPTGAARVERYNDLKLTVAQKKAARVRREGGLR